LGICAGPLAVVIDTYKNNGLSNIGEVPLWLLATGGAFVVLGLATWGYRVIITIGEGLTKVTCSRGFNIEMGSALTVMIGSRLGLPLSTTHCKVGSVVGVGLAEGAAAVNWGMVAQIACGWLVTVPVSAGVSAASYVALRFLTGK
jgi:inorganic phosphate transporter, PiT family